MARKDAGALNIEYSGEDDRSFRLNVTDYSGRT
jgi:hypothetical protein